MRLGHLLAALAAASLAACSGSSSSPANPSAYPTSADRWEAGAGDGTLATATAFPVGGQQARTLYGNGDVDWVKVTLTAGTAYEFSANRLSTSSDLYMWLFDTDGVTSLDSSDDYISLDPRIAFTPPADGTYFLRLWSYDMENGYPDGLASYTLGVHLLVDADGDLQSSYYDCNDAEASVNTDATDVPGDGIDQNCDGIDTPTGLVADAAEPDDTYQTAKAMAVAPGDPYELQLRHDLNRANLRTLPVAGDVDWFKLTVPAHGAFDVERLSYGGTVSLGVYDSDGTTLVSSTISPRVTNPTAAAKTFYLRYLAGSVAAWIVPAAVAIGVDVDGDATYTQDWDGNRDCDDADPDVYPGAPEALGDGVDSNCDGQDDT